MLQKRLYNPIPAHYLMMWRWHFYIGIFVTPFLILLASTGLAMMLSANISGKEREQTTVAVGTVVQPLSLQAQTALDSVDPEHGMVVQYIAPRSSEYVAIFRVQNQEGNHTMVSINPYTAEIVEKFPRNNDVYHLMNHIHSDILMGKLGDYLLETATALTILLILTGIYLWYSTSQGSITRMLWAIRWRKGRSFWRSLHGVIGAWTSVVLLIFCVTGMAWAGVWGEKIVQAWAQFPAGKFGGTPLPQSTVLHEDLNDGRYKDIPWVLEKTPMPVSGSVLGQDGIAQDIPVTFESVNRFAQESGFEGRYHIYFPKGDEGTWVINQDSMSYDNHQPTSDHTIHLDRYTGKVLADIRFDDYNWFGKFMAISVAFHMGTMGWWNISFNTLFCLAIILLCISGWVMWWKRRPNKVIGLVSPTYHQSSLPTWKTATSILLLVALLFPTALVAILIVWLLDKLLLSRVQILSQWFR